MNPLLVLQANPVLALAMAFVLGLVLGSFLNVVVARLPVMIERDWRRECAHTETREHHTPEEPFNLVVPRSRCPHCGHRIGALENIPILSFLALRGRCAHCGVRIGWRYPLVEALTGVLSLVVVWRFGVGAAAAGALLATWMLIALTFIDLDQQLLPDTLTLPLLWLGLLFNLDGTFAPLAEAVVGAVAGYLTLWLVFHAFRLLTGKEGMGYGDFKLLGALGAWVGWPLLPLVVLLSSLVGALVGIALIAFRRHDRNVPIPFGPYLAVAGWVALLWGHELLGAYLHLGTGR